MLFIVFLFLSFYEFLYFFSNGGSLAFVLLVSFIANAVMAYKIMED